MRRIGKEISLRELKKFDIVKFKKWNSKVIDLKVDVPVLILSVETESFVFLENPFEIESRMGKISADSQVEMTLIGRMEMVEELKYQLSDLEPGQLFKITEESSTNFIKTNHSYTEEKGFCECVNLSTGMIWSFQENKVVYPVENNI